MRRSGSSFEHCKVLGLELFRLKVSEHAEGFDWSFESSTTSGSGKFLGPRIGDAYEAALSAAISALAAPVPKKQYGLLIVDELRTGEAKVYDIGGQGKGKSVSSSYSEVGHFSSKFAAWRFIDEQRAGIGPVTSVPEVGPSDQSR